jgi:hypothetical protein
MKKLLSTLALATLFSTTANAQLIQIGTPTCTGAFAIGSVCDDVTAIANEAVNQDFPDIGADGFATGFATATAYSGAGLSEYADNFDYAIVSLNAAAGASIEASALDGQSDNATGGIAVMPSLSIGLNLGILPVDKLGPIDLKKTDFIFGFMSYDMDQDYDGNNFKGELSTISLMFRYRMFEDVAIVPGKLVHWGGLHLHAGFRRSTFKVNMTTDLDIDPVATGVPTYDMTFNDMVANFDLENTVNTIPIEVSTYMRLGWAFTFYAGLGADINMGGGEMRLNANGTMEAGNGTTDVFNASVSSNAVDGEGDAVSGMRAFGGMQINLPFIRLINLQMNKNLGGDNESLAVKGSIKVLW